MGKGIPQLRRMANVVEEIMLEEMAVHSEYVEGGDGGGERPGLDVLIVCGQGVYQDGRYFAEFDDRDVYLRHALMVTGVARRYGYEWVVCSGGPTQEQAPGMTEAASFAAMWRDTGARPPTQLVLEDRALDSAENTLLGLMAIRKHLGRDVGPVRRVGVWTAWHFKKWRFTANAETLGIVERFYFHALAGADATDREVPKQMREPLAGTDDPRRGDEMVLLLRQRFVDKRRARWKSSAPYETRLEPYRRSFPATFAALDALRGAVERFDDAELKAALWNAPTGSVFDRLRGNLRAAFATEVLLTD